MYWTSLISEEKHKHVLFRWSVDSDDLRTANIIADEQEGVTCLVIDRETFNQLISSLDEIRTRYKDEGVERRRWVTLSWDICVFCVTADTWQWWISVLNVRVVHDCRRVTLVNLLFCCAWLHIHDNDEPFILLCASSRDHRHSKFPLALAKSTVLFIFNWKLLEAVCSLFSDML